MNDRSRRVFYCFLPFMFLGGEGLSWFVEKYTCIFFFWPKAQSLCGQAHKKGMYNRLSPCQAHAPFAPERNMRLQERPTHPPLAVVPTRPFPFHQGPLQAAEAVPGAQQNNVQPTDNVTLLCLLNRNGRGDAGQ